MIVEVDADELYKFMSNASSTSVFWGIDWSKDTVSATMEENKKLKEERDWWRDVALSYEESILESVKILDEGPLYSTEAEKLGYE